MGLPESAVLVTVKGHRWDLDGTGAQRKVTATPDVDHVTTTLDHGTVELESVSATPSESDPFWGVEVVASDCPGLVPTVPWTFTFEGYTGAWSVLVPADTPVDPDTGRREVWLTDLDVLAPVVSVPPSVLDTVYTRNAVDAMFTVVDDDVDDLQADLTGHTADTANPHAVTAAQLADLAAAVQGIVAAALVAGIGIELAHDPVAGTVTIHSTGGGDGGLGVEAVRDTIADTLDGGAHISVAVDDAADTVTIGVTGLAAVATSGSASDLTTGTVDDARIPAGIARAADLADVAVSGAYADLTGAPTVPDSPDDIGAAPAADLAAHTGDTTNPHAVTAAQVGLGQVDNTADTAKPVSTAQQAELDGKVPTTRQVTGGTGLTGGGTLAADRTLAVAYGTTSSTAARGDDPRLSDARTPTDGSVTNVKVAPEAGIAESKLSLASDAAAGTASRRTLGTGAQQAAAGDDPRLSDTRGWVLYTPGSETAGDVPVWDGTSYTPAPAASGGGDLPEFSSSAQTVALVASGMLDKLVRYNTSGGAITQVLPPALAGALLAVGWDAGAGAVTLTAAGSDVIGPGAATSLLVPTLGEVLTLHCTTPGRWRVTGGYKPQPSLDARHGVVTATQTIPYAATVTPDPAAANSGAVTATGALTVNAPSNGRVGQGYVLAVTASGADRAVTLSGYTLAAGTSAAVTVPTGVTVLFCLFRHTAGWWVVAQATGT